MFHTTNLAHTDHTIEIRASGSNASLILFDNMVYTVDEADPSSSSLGSTFTIVPPTSNSPDPSPSSAATGAAREFRSSPPIGAIAGGVAGGVAILSLLFVLYCYLRKRATKRARQPEISVHTAMAYVFNSPNALERPSTHPDAVSVKALCPQRLYIHINIESHSNPRTRWISAALRHGPPWHPTQSLRSSPKVPPAP